MVKKYNYIGNIRKWVRIMKFKKDEYIKIWIAILIQALLILSLIFKVNGLIDSINILNRGFINFQEQFSVFITHFNDYLKLMVIKQ